MRRNLALPHWGGTHPITPKDEAQSDAATLEKAFLTDHLYPSDPDVCRWVESSIGRVDCWEPDSLHELRIIEFLESTQATTSTDSGRFSFQKLIQSLLAAWRFVY